MLPMPEHNTLSQAHISYFDSQVQVKRKAVDVERSRFFPELSVGYSRQKIEPLSGLNSWSVGVAVPIVFFPQKSKVKQARAEAAIAQWDAEDNRMKLRNKVDELTLQLERQQRTINYYTGDALKQADELQRNAMMLYKESETGIVELLHSIATANDIRKAYVDALRDYNVMLLELELYTGN